MLAAKSLILAALLLASGCAPLCPPTYYVPADGLNLRDFPCYVLTNDATGSVVAVYRDRFSECPPFASLYERMRRAEEITSSKITGSLLIVGATGVHCGKARSAKGCTVWGEYGAHKMTVMGHSVLATSQHEMQHVGLFNRKASDLEHYELDHPLTHESGRWEHTKLRGDR